MGPVLIFGLSALLLSLLSAVLSATETAYAVSARSDLENLASEKKRAHRSISLIINDFQPHLSALSFSRIFLESIAAALMTAALILVFARVWQIMLAAAVLVAFLSFLVVVAGPKNYGQRYPNEVIIYTAWLTRVLRVCLGPLASGMSKIVSKAHDKNTSYDEKVKNEQLFSMVDRAAEQDLLEDEEKGIIQSVLGFGETIVREVMVPRTDMFTLDLEQPVKEAFEEMLASRHSRAPVISDGSDDIVGVVYIRDLAGFVYRNPEEAVDHTISRIMKPAQFVPDLQRTDDLLRLMQKEANHLALAVDEHGGIAGLVTMEDLIEELVGDIYDEHDREETDVIHIYEDLYQLNARLDIDELTELFGEEFEDEDVETVGGLFVKYLGRLAEPQDKVRIGNIELEAHRVEGKKRLLKTVLATKIKENPDEGKTNIIRDGEDKKRE